MTGRTWITTAMLLAACGVSPPSAPNAGPANPPPGGGSPGSTLTGQFAGLQGHSAAGGVTVELAGGVATITLASDFSSTTVPDPHLYLNTVSDANVGQPIRIARLTSAQGAQVYTAQVPAGVAYRYVLVWCDQANVGVGAALLH
jgi:hypothetical protein